MSRKLKRTFSDWIKTVFPYILVTALVLMIVIVGAVSKMNASASLSLDSIVTGTSEVSVDSMTELYTVADLSNTLGLASAGDVADNYVMTTTMYDSGQTTAGKLEKPSLTDVDASRGVVEHVLAEGESIDSVAADYGVSTDQIRWSNGLKSTEVAVGTTLYVPSSSGIVYTVKSNDTIESIASKYGSTVEEITALNDLEVSGISEGMKILVKDGSLPETERPEYVPPAPVRTYTTYAYTYLGNTSERTNAVCNRAQGAGQCTTWAWQKRPDLRVVQANANGWAALAAAYGFQVDKTPAAGAVFQTPSGWYGHVGYVESVNADGSINVSERNYSGCYGVLYSTIPASAVGNFNYIH